MLEVATVDRTQELIPEVSGVISGVDEGVGCWRPLDGDEPGGRVLVPLVGDEVLNCVDIGSIESGIIPSFQSGMCFRTVVLCRHLFSPVDMSCVLLIWWISEVVDHRFGSCDLGGLKVRVTVNGQSLSLKELDPTLPIVMSAQRPRVNLC